MAATRFLYIDNYTEGHLLALSTDGTLANAGPTQADPTFQTDLLGQPFVADTDYWVVDTDPLTPSVAPVIRRVRFDSETTAATGTPGKDGKDGSQILTGPVDPTVLGGTSGKAKDVYFNTVTGDFFQRIDDLPNNHAGTWFLLFNIKGPRGQQGPAGPPGSGGSGGVTFMPVPAFSGSTASDDAFAYFQDYPNPGDNDNGNTVVTFQTIHDLVFNALIIFSSLQYGLENKVNKQDGYGLSQVNFTTELYNRLNSLVNGQPLPLSNFNFGGTTFYAPILTLPASSGGTYDESILVVGLSAWDGSNKQSLRIQCSNRSGFRVSSLIRYGDPNASGLVAYQDGAGQVTLYIRASNGFNVNSVTYVSLVQTTPVGSLNYQNAIPTGTLVYDSSTTKPDLGIGQGLVARQINAGTNLTKIVGWDDTTGNIQYQTAQQLADLLKPLIGAGGTITPVVPLVVAVLSYNSTTGVLTMTSGGGGNSVVQYRIPNLFDWQADAHFTIPDNLRDGNTILTIECRADTRSTSTTFKPYLPTATAWLGKVAVSRDVNSHGYGVMAEGLNCPSGVNLSITRTDGIAQSGTSSGVNWQTGTARQMLANNDATYKLFLAFYPGAGGPGLTPGYNYLLLFTNLATQETKTFSDYFSPGANADGVVLQQVVSDPTNPVTPTDPVTPTTGNPYDYTYTISDTRTDSTGTPFTRTTAPVYAEVVNDHPVAPANQYTFIDQKAKGVAFWSRFPPFQVDAIMLLWGPWYSVATANNLFDRGITAVNTWPYWRQGPTDTRNLPAERKDYMYDDDACRAYCQIVMNQYGGGDPRYGVWDAFKNGRSYSDPGNAQTQPAFKAIGAAMWSGEKSNEDAAGRGVKYMSYDLESTPNNYQFQRHCIGWMYQGYIDAAAVDGLFPILFMYGQFQFLVNIYDFSDTQLASGYPQYVNLSEQGRDILGDIDPSLQAVNQSNGTISMDGYFQGIWGYDALLKRNSDQTPILSGGKPVFNDILQTTLYGQTVPLQGPVSQFATEAQRFVSDLYRHAGRLFCQWFFIAGAYPETTTSRRAGLEKSHVGAIGRPTNEGDGIAGMTYNDRPLALWHMEVQTMLDVWHSVGGGVNAMWGSDMNQPPTVPGTHPATNSPVWTYNAHGVQEGCVKGLHRYSQFRSIRTGVGRWGWSNFDVQDHNNIDGQYPWQKSIKRFRFWGTGDNQYIEMLVINPLLDSRSNTGKLWINQNGKKSLAYTIKTTDGREGYFYDCWKLPAGFNTINGKDVIYQEPDILGVVRTCSADYRFPVSGNPTPPADFTPTTTTPTTNPFSVSGTYNRTSHKLILAGANAVGGITYNIVGITEGYAGQPTDGFDVPASLRDGSQTLNIAAKTASNQAAQTTISIPADQVAPISSANPMPEIMMGLFPLSTSPLRYQSTEQPARFVNLYTQAVTQNDGIHIEGLSTTQNPRWIPAYVTEFGDLKAQVDANGNWGFYLAYKWSDFVVDANGSESGTWVAHNLLTTWKQQVSAIMATAKAKGLKVHIVFWPGRDNGYMEYLPVSERALGHNSQLTNAAVDVPAHYLYHDVKTAGFDVNNINTATSVGKYLSDLKDACRFLRQFQVDGTLTAIGKGTHTNSELGWNTRQDDPASSWTDFSPTAIARMQGYISTLYGGNLATLNQQWGTAYGDFNQIQYNFTGDFNDFKGQKGLDLQKYRHVVLGDAIELMDRVTWSELPGILVNNQFGQPKGGQGPILGTIDIPYLLGRSWAVSDELGQNAPVGVKYNPEVVENHRAYACLMKYVAYQAAGSARKVFVSEEDSYTENGDLSAVHASNNLADTLSYGRTGRSNDGVGAVFVLFNPKQWAGLQPDGVTGKDQFGNYTDPAQSVKSALTRLASLTRRKTAATGFGTTDAAKTITVTMPEILNNIFVYGPKFSQWQDQLSGDTQDVAWRIQGLGLAIDVAPPTLGTCVPMAGGTLGADSTVTQNSELVISFDGLSGSTDTLQFTWIESNGVVVVQGGGAGDFAVRLRFPNVGTFTVTAKAQNACGSVTRSVNITVPAPVDPASTQPYFDVSVDQPVLQGNGTYSQAVVHFTNVKNGTRYKIFAGDVTDNTQDFYQDFTGASTQFTLPAPASGVSKKFSFRLWPGADTAHWADRSVTVTSPASAPTQYIVAIQTKRTPGQVNQNGVQLRVQTAGGYVPKFAFSKTGFPVLSNSSGDVPAFQQGSYQYGTIISDLPNTGSEYITVGFVDSSGRVAQILISDKAGTDSDWVTQYPLSF